MSYDANLDFNTDEDYKESPLVPDGTYHANVVAVQFNAEKYRIDWTVTLVDNGGVMTDGETEIDGTQHKFTIWLPKPGDENELTASGKMTKRQSKINSFARFVKDMKLQEKTVSAMVQCIDEADYLGVDVDCTLQTREFPEGNFFNQIQNMRVA